MANKFNKDVFALSNTIDFEDKDTLIMMDTNVWLDLYKLPPTAIISIVDVISVHLKKFWIPNQVYVEFNRHLKKNRDEARGRYINIKSMSCELLNNAKTKINQEFENLKRNNLFEALQAQDRFHTKMTETISQLKADLIALDEEYQKDMFCISSIDIIQDLIEKLYESSNSQGFSIMQLMNIYEEGETRYKYKVAPGHTDIKKANHENDNDFLLRKYGDLITWKQILKHIKGTRTRLVFVQNEKKSDWWQSPEIHKIAPVLVEEYLEVTSNKGSIVMVSFEQLLNNYGEQLGLPATTIKDIVAKLKLEKAVCKYVSDNRKSIIEDYIYKAFQEDDRAYELVQDISLFGGTVESVEYIEVDTINILNNSFSYDKDWDLNYVGAIAEIDCSADLTEYVNKYVSHSGRIDFKIHFEIMINFSIDFSDLEAEPESAYEITDYEISDEEIIELSHGEFSIDVDYDEDMYRDR